jgi:hypothetical protein
MGNGPSKGRAGAIVKIGEHCYSSHFQRRVDMKKLAEMLTGVVMFCLGFPLVGSHPLAGVVSLVTAGLLFLDGFSGLL